MSIIKKKKLLDDIHKRSVVLLKQRDIKDMKSSMSAVGDSVSRKAEKEGKKLDYFHNTLY